MKLADIARQYRAGLLPEAEFAKLKPEDQKAIALDPEGARRSFHVCEQRLKFDAKDPNIVRNVVISSDRVNRGGMVILSKGVDLRHFGNNPRLLFGHDDISAETNLGWVNNVTRKPGGRLGEVLVVDEQYLGEDVNPYAQFILGMVKAGAFPARSTGILPLENGLRWVEDEAERKALGFNGPGVVIERYELLEESIVTLPKNADAVSNGLRERVEGIWRQHLKDAPGEVRSWVENSLAPTEEELERIERHRHRGFVAMPAQGEVLFQRAPAGQDDDEPREGVLLQAEPSQDLRELTAAVLGMTERVGELVDTISNAMQDGEAGEGEASSMPGSEPGAQRESHRSRDWYAALYDAVTNRGA